MFSSVSFSDLTVVGTALLRRSGTEASTLPIHIVLYRIQLTHEADHFREASFDR